jgi:predicted MFS family arabinose efflux permease
VTTLTTGPRVDEPPAPNKHVHLTQSRYARALRSRGVRPVLLAGLAVRVSAGAALVVVVLHVVADLHRSYGMAGLVATMLGIATALASPWRGRLLDRVGLRRTLGTSVAMLAVMWAASAWVGYWPLLALTAISGLYALPTLAVVRSALDAAAGDELRATVMTLDAIAADAAYLPGPACGIALATRFGDRLVLTACLLTYPVGGLLLWLLNPNRAAPRSSPPAKCGRGIPGGKTAALIVAAPSHARSSTVAASCRPWPL